MSQLSAWTLALNLGAGLLMGTAYFLTLRWTTDRLAAGHGIPVTVAIILARFILLGGALALVSLQGALPLLLTALGVFIGRAVVLWRARMAGA